MKPIKFSNGVCDVTIISPIIVASPAASLSFTQELVNENTGEKIHFGITIETKCKGPELESYNLVQVALNVSETISKRITAAMAKEHKVVSFEKREMLCVDDGHYGLYDNHGVHLQHLVHGMIQQPRLLPWVTGTISTLAMNGIASIQEIKLRAHGITVTLIDVDELKRRRVYKQEENRLGSTTSLGLMKMLGKEFAVRFVPCVGGQTDRTAFIDWMDHIDRETTQTELASMLEVAFPWIKPAADEGTIAFFDDVGSKNPRNAQPSSKRTVKRYKLAK